MSDSLLDLEKRRSEVLAEISTLGDFRPGSISATSGRCGNPNCHCHKPHDPGHGPNLRLTYKVQGKTVTESFPTPAAQRKAEREIAAFRQFQELIRTLLETNEKICRLRPVEDTLTPQEKKTAETFRQEVEGEISALLRLVFQEQRKTGRLDLEAVEMAMRAAVHGAGAAALSHLLRCDPPGPDERQIPCPCGHKARYREMRSRHVLTAVGEMEFLRPWYLCPQCHNGQSPVDAALDIEKADLSPGVRRMLALVGSQAPFEHGRQQMEVLAGLAVTAKAVERTAEAIGGHIAQGEQREIQRALQLDLPVVVGKPIPILYVQMDGTGVPVVKKETAGRQGKTNGQPAHTREVKFGCAFTQTMWDQEGYPIRDADSTTYTGAIENAEEFGKRIYLEACKRGWSRAEKKVVIGDGAEWIWNLADLHFSGALQIVDLYHARQHLWEVARKLHPNHVANQKVWMKLHQKQLLDKGKIEKLVLSLRSIDSTNSEVIDKIRSEAEYFEKNAARMRYPKFRRQRLFVGSGVIEAGCKTVIGTRLKQSGMFWTIRGANAIIALRCCQLNNRFEDYWEARRAA